MSDENAIVPVDKNELAGVEMFDLNENLEGVKPKLPSIKILHQANMFELPTGEKVESFPCIILDQFPANAYWKESFSDTGGGSPPDCFSMNGIQPDPSGDDVQAATCKECAQNQFGSAGRGKACKNMKRVHVLMDSSSYPHRITIPPTSVGQFDSYIATVTDMGAPFQLVYSELSLRETKNKDGIKYSEMSFKALSGITDMDIAKNIKAQINNWMEAMRGEPIIRDEYGDD